MKVDELRAKIKNKTREQLMFLLAEMYKAIPKSVREAKYIDALIERADSSDSSDIGKQPEVSKNIVNIDEVLTFISNAQNQYYCIPNKVVSKSERPKWRFKVAAWYKNIVAAIEKTPQIANDYAPLLEQLYNLMCKAEAYSIFSTFEPFRSIGIDRDKFLESVLYSNHSYQSRDSFVRGVIDSYSEDWYSRQTITTFLEKYNYLATAINEIIDKLDRTAKHHKEAKMAYEALSAKEKRKSLPPSESEYQFRQNKVAEFMLILYVAWGEEEEGVEQFNKYYKTSNEEVKLFILISKLINSANGELILSEIERVERKGITIRNALIMLKETIQTTGQVPHRMPN